LCWTPYAGLCLLVPLIPSPVLLSAARHWALTLVTPPLGFRRIFHLSDFRHLCAPFHLATGRCVGLVVTGAKRALSQVLPTLITKVRRLRGQWMPAYRPAIEPMRRSSER